MLGAEQPGGDAVQHVSAITSTLAMLGVLAGAHAGSAAGPACPLLSDPRGDAWQPDQATSVARQRPELDVVSATVWSDTAALSIVIRLTELAPAGPGERLMYSFYVNNTETSYVVEANRSLLGGDFFRLVGPSAGDLPVGGAAPVVTGSFDEARDEIRMALPLRAIDTSEGATLQGITVDSWGLLEAGAAGYSVFSGTTVDRTTMGHTHVVGDRRCAR